MIKIVHRATFFKQNFYNLFYFDYIHLYNFSLFYNYDVKEVEPLESSSCFRKTFFEQGRIQFPSDGRRQNTNLYRWVSWASWIFRSYLHPFSTAKYWVNRDLEHSFKNKARCVLLKWKDFTWFLFKPLLFF